jgi:putative peptidoglycan lipid II flippase
MNRARHLLKSSLIVILFFGLGKLAGLVRLFLVANTFGTSPEYDAFTAANQLPELFFTLIAGGALAAAFIPVYSQYLTQESEKQAARLANIILTLVLLALGGVCLVAAVLAPWITSRLLVPSFTPEQQQLTAVIMRVILIQTTLFGISGVLSSILNAHQHFALPALAPIALDIGYIIGLIYLVPEMGVLGLAWGTVLGGILHILIQLPAVVKYRFRYRPALDMQLAGVREIIRLMGPRIVTLGVIQLADLFIIRLASGLPEGSTSSYFYGYALMQFPETLLGTAVAIVIFPTLAELFNAGDIEGLKRTAVTALRIIWFLTIPAAALVVLLGRPALSLLFDETATAIIFSVLVVFSVRIVSEATNEIVARLFYARHNTRTPMFAYIGWLAVNVLFAYLLVKQWGVAGLAMASTIAFTFLAALLYWLNRRELGELGGRLLRVTAVRALIATTSMVVVILVLMAVVPNTAVTTRLIDASRPITLLAQVLYLSFLAAVGLAIYLGIDYGLGGREIPALIHLARRRSQVEQAF